MTQTETLPADAATGAGLDREAVLALSRRNQEPAWLRDLRLAAWETYAQLPMPTQRDPQWKRTGLAGLDLRSVVPFQAADAVAGPDALPRELRATAKNAATLGGLQVQRDSSVVFSTLQADLARQGVILSSLDTAVREHPDLVRERLGAVIAASHGKFQALNAALWSGGLFVYVPRGKAVELPLQMIVSIGTADLGLFPRSLVIVEDGAELALVEEFTCGAGLGQPLISSVAELFAGANARIRYVTVQDWASEAWHFATVRASQARDAAVYLVQAATGGRVTKQWVDSIMTGRGAHAQLMGLMFGDGTQHFDSYTLQDHIGDDSTSELLYKLALRDQANSNFTGLVRVNKETHRAAAGQENRNLLLSDSAKADSEPMLEILNSDVIRCSHGATVGPVDQTALFYLMTRGLSPDEAERLLVEGFFDPVISRVPVESLQKKLWATVHRKLEA